MSHRQLYGGIEAGGTKVICATGDGSDELCASVEIPTLDPESTIRAAISFFQSQIDAGEDLSGIGIGCFGPLELDTRSPTYGRILTTPKPGWQNFDIRGEIARAMDLPVAIDTDVNVAAVGEWRWGALQGVRHGLYVTVGTGIGVGAIVDEQILFGKHHPEMGHMFIPQHPDEPAEFEGVCPYHQVCVEGLASGTSIVSRWGRKLDALPQDHPAWQLEAGYLAKFLSNLTFTLQPQRIVVGGGVMNDALLVMIREATHAALAGFRSTLVEKSAMTEYLVLPALKGRAGVLGAIAMAAQ